LELPDICYDAGGRQRTSCTVIVEHYPAAVSQSHIGNRALLRRRLTPHSSEIRADSTFPCPESVKALNKAGLEASVGVYGSSGVIFHKQQHHHHKSLPPQHQPQQSTSARWDSTQQHHHPHHLGFDVKIVPEISGAPPRRRSGAADAA